MAAAVRPTHQQPTTSRQARAQFKKHGARVSTQEARQLERGAELFRRAEKIRDAEKRRKAALKKKHEREQRDRETRRRLNVASQQPYVSQHQMRLNNFIQTNAFHQPPIEALDPNLFDDVDLDDLILGEMEAGIKENTHLPAVAEEDLLGDADLLDGEVDFEVDKQSQDDLNTRHFTAPSADVDNNEKRHGQDNTDTATENYSFTSESDLWESFMSEDTNVVCRASEIEKLDGIQNRIPSDDCPIMSTQDVALSCDDLAELGLILPATTKHDMIETIDPRKKPPEPHAGVDAAALTKPHERIDTIKHSPLTDRELMPPPPVPLVRTQKLKSAEKLIFQNNRAVVDDLLLQDALASDFELSTQDCREIFV